MSKAKRGSKWNDDHSLLQIYKRLYPKASLVYFGWWAAGVCDERQQRGDYNKRSKP